MRRDSEYIQDEFAHPTLETIRAFASGKLDSQSLHRVEAHISECKDCCVALESVPDDTLADLLRSATKTIEKPNLRLVTGYEIKGELGRGGMGIVFLATQPALRRDVALKMISRGEQANAQDLARFRREGRAIASLQHPYIAQVYEVGDQAGRPYISMELVRGGTLAHLLRNGPLSIREATQLIIKVAEAVAHAHSRGVIHRDLKPSNILLEQDEVVRNASQESLNLIPKIVDFGLAKRTGLQETATISGMLVGTPSYMSPEQASGHNETAVETADVYALGAIFYETLVGRPPFRGSNPVETLEQVRTLEPVRPKSLRFDVPRDLETICLKCLEKSPSRRYPSAKDMLDELSRFVDGRPILAKPSSWPMRLIKWTKRHRAVTAVASVFAISTIGLLSVSLIYNQYLSEALGGARAERSRADANFRYAFSAVERMLERVGFSELANQPGMETVRESLLQDAVTFYSSLLAEQPAENVDARRQYCTALSRLGRLQLMLGHIDDSRVSLTNAIDMQKSLSAELPDRNDIRHELAISHINLGTLEKWSDREFQIAIDLLKPLEAVYPVCRPELAEAMNLYANTLPPEIGAKFHLEVVTIRRELSQDSPKDPHLLHVLGQSLHNLGHTYYRLGKNELAVDALEEAIGYFQKLVSSHGTVADYQVSLAESSAVLASIEHDNGNFAVSNTLIERCTAVRTLLVGRYPNTPAYAKNLAQAHMTHAAFLIQRQEFTSAVNQSELADQILERLSKDYLLEEYQSLVTSNLTLLATALGGDHRDREAHEVFEKASVAYERLLVQSPQNVSYQTEAAVHFMNYSNLLRPEDPTKALLYNTRAATILTQVVAIQPTRSDFRSYLFNAQGALAQTHEILSNHLQAAEAWERALTLSSGERMNELKIARGLSLARALSLDKAANAADELRTAKDLRGDELYNVACLYGLLDKQSSGESKFREHSFEILNRSECLTFLSFLENLEQLKVDVDLETIRTDDRFQQLLKRLAHID